MTIATSRPSPEEWLQILPAKIENTALGYDVSREDILNLCQVSVREGFYGVVVNPPYIRYAAEELSGTTLRVISVVGFPHGAHTANAKVYEARDAFARGAHEVDMVVNVAALIFGYYDVVRAELQDVVTAAEGKPVKAILECGALTADQKRAGAEIAAAAGVAMVKTSTGFGPGGATEEDVRLLREVVGRRCGIKASGGIRSYERALKLVEAGADRIGTSSGVVIVEGLRYAAKSGRLAVPAWA